MIDLAGAMGIDAVAEGVETLAQVSGLQDLGCQVAQGFYFSHPLRADDFDALLTKHFAPDGPEVVLINAGGGAGAAAAAAMTSRSHGMPSLAAVRGTRA